MGYFDEIDNKTNVIVEVDEIENLAGHNFWFSVGSSGIFLHAFVFMILFWSQFGSISDFITGNFVAGEVGEAAQSLGGTYSLILVIAICVVFAISFALSIVGMVFSIKSHKLAAMSRQKNPLNGMATSFNLLWIVLDIILIAFNIAFAVHIIAPYL